MVERVVTIDEVRVRAVRRFAWRSPPTNDRWLSRLTASTACSGWRSACWVPGSLVAVVQVMIALPLQRLRGALAAVREGRQLRLEGSFPPKCNRWSKNSIPCWRRMPPSSSGRERRPAISRMR